MAGVSKEERTEFVYGMRSYSPTQAAILACKTGVLPRWLDACQREWLELFWKEERRSKRIV